MKTQSVSFQGGVKISRVVQPEVRNAIKNSSAMKKFGRFYNADIGQIDIGSRSRKNIVYSGLSIDNIEPRNIFVALYDFVTGRNSKRSKHMNFCSYRETSEGLAEVLGQMKKNSLLKMIVKK